MRVHYVLTLNSPSAFVGPGDGEVEGSLVVVVVVNATEIEQFVLPVR